MDILINQGAKFILQTYGICSRIFWLFCLFGLIWYWYLSPLVSKHCFCSCPVGSSIFLFFRFLSVMQIGTYFEKALMHSLEVYKISGPGENQTLKDDFDAIQYLVNDKLLSSVRLIMHVLLHHLKLNTAHINTESSNSEKQAHWSRNL